MLRIGDKPYILTTDTKASVMITRPNITAGLPEREDTQVTQPYIPHMASGNTLPILKKYWHS
jgi:hypothetical protein